MLRGAKTNRTPLLEPAPKKKYFTLRNVVVRVMIPTFYDELGGEQAVRQLVEYFYDTMESNPAYAGIRALHAKNLKISREKQFAFLSGWLGGPPLYIERYGHPRLRARHLPFPIGESERDQWIACMTEAMEQLGVDERLQSELLSALYRVADFMRNKDGEFSIATPRQSQHDNT